MLEGYRSCCAFYFHLPNRLPPSPTLDVSYFLTQHEATDAVQTDKEGGRVSGPA
jgi:hypothetical protein